MEWNDLVGASVIGFIGAAALFAVLVGYSLLLAMLVGVVTFFGLVVGFSWDKTT